MVVYALTGLIAGMLLGTWLFMLCFGPVGFLLCFRDALDDDVMKQLNSLSRGLLGAAMLGLGWLLARLVWRRAPSLRWLIITTTLVLGIPSGLWILFVIAMAGAVPNFGYGG